jgi:hypothetical protein
MYRDVVWLVSFALSIVAIIFGMKVMVPQLQNKSQEIRYEPPPVEAKP